MENEATNSMDILEIMEVLPHRPPFLLVDRVLEYSLEEKTIRAIKCLSVGEGFFQGHFPGRPIMPGVLQLEAMAQVAGILLNKVAGLEGRIAFFTSVDKARFRRPVHPGDVLEITTDLVKVKSFLCKVKGQCYVAGELVSEAELTFAFGRDQ